jgi:hypothetical protein
MVTGFASHRRSPKPVFWANRVRLIRGAILVRTMHRRSRSTIAAHLCAHESDGGDDDRRHLALR